MKVLTQLFLLTSSLMLCACTKHDLTAEYAIPEGGTIANGVYRNSYFGLQYPLLRGWTKDLAGPPPSSTGYYSLVAFKPEGELTATILIAAQDMFFYPKPIKDTMDFLAQMQKDLDPSLTSSEPASVEIAGRSFGRFDFSGAGLQHSVFATEIRCHIVSFIFTSRSSKQIQELAASLNKIPLASDTTSGAASQSKEPTTPWPICVRDYATDDHIVRRTYPVGSSPGFPSVPVRIIIDEQGKVRHIHPIAGSPEHIKSVADALSQWVFKPYVVNGHPVEIETGLRLEFRAKD